MRDPAGLPGRIALPKFPRNLKLLIRHFLRRFAPVLCMTLVSSALALPVAPTASAQPAPAPAEARDPPPPLPREVLKDAKVIATYHPETGTWGWSAIAGHLYRVPLGSHRAAVIGWTGLAITLAAVVVLPALFAFVFGYVSFRSRVNGVYFSIITQALTYTAMLLMFRNDTGFGGNNGMTGFNTIALVTVVVAALGAVAAYALVRPRDFVVAGRPAAAPPQPVPAHQNLTP